MPLRDHAAAGHTSHDRRAPWECLLPRILKLLTSKYQEAFCSPLYALLQPISTRKVDRAHRRKAFGKLLAQKDAVRMAIAEVPREASNVMLHGH